MAPSTSDDRLRGEVERLRARVAELESVGVELREVTEKNSLAFEELVSIFDGIDEPIYVADPDTCDILYVNQATKNLLGEHVGQKCHQYLQGRDDPCPFCTNDKIFGENTGCTYIWEFQNEVSGRWFRCIDKAIHWPDGRLVRCEIAVDITDRKQIEQSLDEIRQRLELAIEGARLGTWDWDLTTLEMTSNVQFAQMLGCSVDELTDRLRAWETMVHEDDIAQTRQELYAHVEGRTPYIETECRVFTHSGKPRWMLVRGKIVERDEQGKPLRMTGTALDIHERKTIQETLRRAQQELEQRVEQRTAELAATNAALRDEIAQRRLAEEALGDSEETARALLNVATEAAVFLDLDSTIVILNETAAQRLGGTVEELVGRRCFDLMPPQLVARWRVYGQEVVRTGQSVRFQDEYEGRVTDTNLCPVFNADGKVVRLAVFNRDITDVKIAEAKIRREQELLHQLLDFQERERQLVAYEIHDGLAQELTGAILRFQAFRESLSSDPAEAWKAFDVALNLLARGIKEARGLITGLRPPVLDELGIAAAIDYLVCESQELGGPRIEFRHDLPTDRLSPSLETAIFRIVQESLTNARHHSQSDRVRLEVRQCDGHVCIDVQDWGVGFDPAEIDARHFGLRGIHERVRLLGGRMDLDAQPGGGTHLSIELPIVERLDKTGDDRPD